MALRLTKPQILFATAITVAIPLAWATYALNWIRERRTDEHAYYYFDDVEPPCGLWLFGERGVDAVYGGPDEHNHLSRLFPEAEVRVMKYEPPRQISIDMSRSATPETRYPPASSNGDIFGPNPPGPPCFESEDFDGCILDVTPPPKDWSGLIILVWTGVTFVLWGVVAAIIAVGLRALLREYSGSAMTAK